MGYDLRSLFWSKRKPVARSQNRARLPCRVRLRLEHLESRSLLAATQFAVIGDFGLDGAQELAVANMVKTWDPDFGITVGDNNYPLGSATTIDPNIGKYYQEFIGNYQGNFGPGSANNRFFPSLGNHDMDNLAAEGPPGQPYVDYFTLPIGTSGNERYYDFVQGPVHFFALDSDIREPDGKSSTSTQAQWLQSALASSTAPYQFVYFHHAPYTSSSGHLPDTTMRWPFKDWGADAVFTGHEHNYERLNVGGLPYFVNGLGGHTSISGFGTTDPNSQFRYNANQGAMLVTADTGLLRFEFYSIANGGTLVDRYTVTSAPTTQETLVPTGSAWKYLDNGSNQGTAWRALVFDDSTWNSGLAQLGYGDGGEATVVSFGPDAANKYITTYFRRSFNVTDPSRYLDATLQLLRDDGAVVYLNGQEVYRNNLPTGTISSTTLASVAVGGADESAYFSAAINPSLLVAGANVIAVEIHQATVGSSDLSFDFALTGTAIANNPPLANDDTYGATEDVVLSIPAPGVLANDSDAEGNPLTATLVSGPANGILTFNANGSFSYTPSPNFNGADSFTYRANDGTSNSNLATVTMNVAAVNDPPVALNDAYSVTQDSSLTVAAPGALANDSDVEGNPLLAVLADPPTNGALTFSTDGSFVYTPTLGFVGGDSFTYQASDGVAGSNVATVAIMVTRANVAPLAMDDTYATAEDMPLSVIAPGVLTNDSDGDGDPLTAVVVLGPTNGTLALISDGSFTYTPNANFSGADSFTYRASDGIATSAPAMVTINVAAVADAPAAVADSYATSEDSTLTVLAPGILANDSDADGDALSAVLVTDPANGTLTLQANGSFTYVPADNFNGGDSFTYRASDGTLTSATTTVSIQVSAINDPPTAAPQSVATNEDTAVSVTLVGQDGDPEAAQSLTFAITSAPTQGSLSNFNPATGAVTYTPALNLSGSDSFTFTVTDDATAGGAALTSAPATVTISITPVNDPPVSGNDGYSVKSATMLSVAAPGVLANDTDVEGSPLSAVLLSGPASGTLTLNPDGSFTYQSNAGFSGTDQFTYQASDGTTTGNAATVTITVEPNVLLYFALAADRTVGGLSVANEDIIAFDGVNFTLFFDGSDVGLAALAIDAVAILNTSEVLLSFTAAGSIPGIAGTVDDSDFVRFNATSLGDVTAGTFTFYFDGSDVGLTTNGEDVDAVELLSDGRLLISTTDVATVSGASGEDEDILAFTPISLGNDTSGTWSLYFDGSDVGLTTSNEDLDGIGLDPAGKIYLSTVGGFSVNGIAGADEDVFVFTPSILGSSTAGTFSSTLFFDGSLYGLGANDLIAIELPDAIAASVGIQGAAAAALAAEAPAPAMAALVTFSSTLETSASEPPSGSTAQPPTKTLGIHEGAPLQPETISAPAVDRLMGKLGRRSPEREQDDLLELDCLLALAAGNNAGLGLP